ncbi:multi drug resistance-associated protein MRP [Syncephalis fuscata]|nr:multi drug resistance-associated protein MRP [Syncephalis fuscata]
MLPRSITELCHNPEGWGPWSRRRTFDFTPCFLETVVVTIPWFLMAIVASVRIEELRSRSELASNLTKSRLYITKMSILGAMLGVTVYDFVYLLIHQSSVVVTSSNLSDIFLITAMIVAIILQHYEHTRNRIPSSIFLLFWPVALMADVIQIRSWILRDISHKENTRFWLLLVRTTCSLLAFIVEFIRKPVLDYQSIGDHQDLSIEEKSNIYSYLTFQWMSPILALGYQRPLVMNDLWPVSSKHRTRYVSSLFDNCWNYYLNRGQPSLVKTLVYSFGSKMLVSGVCKFIHDLLAFVQPFLLSKLMIFVSSYATKHPLPAYQGFLISGSMFLATLIQTCFLHQYFQLSQVTGMNVRTAMSTAIYRKALRLSNASRQKYTTGEIVNMMSVDAQRCESLCNFLHLLWSSPFQIILALAMLYRTLGWSALAGVAIMVLSIPANAKVATYLRSLQLQQMKNKDQRTKLMDEILSGIKVIKLYAWEIPFFKKIRAIRNDRELKTLKNTVLVLATFGVYALLDGKSHGPLDASLIFVSLSLFNLLGFPLSAFPQVITFVIEASRTSLSAHAETGELSRREPNVVVMRDASFAWDGTDESQTISNVSFSCDRGTLLAVVGRVGSGKSSLISALLGDMAKLHGEVELKGTVAYAAQQPWIMNATLRENILFGHAYDPDFYQKTIEACALTQDFEMLPGGDQTEIGEKGINLSGGQKARVSLARAVYAMADIYLLDDTLSAVDSHVGRHIFNHVIGPKGLLKNRARIFVTHALQYVHDADQVMMLRDGRVVEFDSFDALMEQQGELYNLVAEFVKGEEEEALDAEAEAEAEIELNSESLKEALSRSVGGHSAHSDVDAEIPRRPLRKTITHETLKSLRRTSMASVDSEDGVMRQGNVTGTNALMTVEESAKGRVSLDVYAAYFKSCSIKNVILYGLLGLATQSGTIASSIWLKRWSEYNQEHPNNDDASFYLISYAIIGITTVMILWGQQVVLYALCVYRSAKVTHESMLLGVVRSPMSFFDTTPLGRILNRFSKDQTTIDENIPLVIIPLTFIYVYVQRYYLESSRELKRLDSVSRSPVFAHFQETLGGASTIRAYRQTKRFAQESRWRIDENLKAYYLWVSLNRWLAVRLEFVGKYYSSIVILSASMLAVVTTVTTGNTNASLVGLAVTNALYITQSLNWCVRMFCEIETNIVSMERLQEYAELPSEAPEIIEGRRPSHFWPERGVIKFTDYQTRYREGLELVLKGVSFDVKSREKIGIVGRTGAGKSSLTLSLFRLIEAAAGSITIDGVDISQIGLYDLRSRLTIIPQDPVLFAGKLGTVRDNLDPFETHEDIEIWNVLNSAHLKDHISSLEGKLNAPVIQGGENFSVGQRQLICLARALLRRSSILVLDEATAAIDVETDKAIQETIRREFKNCTILTIAHRINTVMDNDRILVLDGGKIAEYDSPTNLLAKYDSIFYSLAKEAGLG